VIIVNMRLKSSARSALRLHFREKTASRGPQHNALFDMAAKRQSSSAADTLITCWRMGVSRRVFRKPPLYQPCFEGAIAHWSLKISLARTTL